MTRSRANPSPPPCTCSPSPSTTTRSPSSPCGAARGTNFSRTLGARRGGTASAAAQPGAPAAPPLSDVLDSYYTAPAQPSAPPPPEVAVDSLLDQVPSTSVTVRGQNLPDVLRLAYRALGDTAATEADDGRARPSQGRDPRSP